MLWLNGLRLGSPFDQFQAASTVIGWSYLRGRSRHKGSFSLSLHI
jgi:hypothetical protein